ncbi:CGNR zinc finger domain-containing protein [Curtobacterium pusillum]|uniref:CGNR zinc finger domain-containing protein n=1 Tax=Curtobacterium pusillum TaxID=69373 RepID=UPI00381C4B98
MPVSANVRSGVAAAPGGLELVQELLNTAPSGLWAPTADLLDDGGDGWTTAWFPGVPIEAGGRAALRELRDSLRAALRGGVARPVAAPVVVELDPTGTARPGDATDPIGRVLAEVLLAQARGDWRRLKVCALDQCGTAFWDRSRNTSGRFHAVRCANFVNLRASRERQRQRQDG